MSNVVEFVYRLTDKFSPTLAKIASSASSASVKIEQTRTKFDKLGSSINGLNAKMSQLLEKRNASQSVNEIRKLNGEIRKLERQAQKLENLPPQGFINRLRYSQEGFGGIIKTALKGYSVMQAWQGLKLFAGLGMDMEQTRAKFRVLLGTVDKGNKMIADLNNMANVTPFKNADLIKNAETLLAFNVAGEKILPTMKMLGDVAMGDKNKLQGLTLAYSQMMSTGRLMGQDLLQMINQGFNPLVELEKMTGKPLAKLKKSMEEGKISSQMVEEAFKHATAEGGQFYQMMDKMSETGEGKFSTFLGKIQAKLTVYAEKLNPYIVKLMNLGIAFADNFEKIMQPFVFLFKTVSNGIMTVTRWMVQNKAIVVTLTVVIAAYRLMVWQAALASKGWTIASMLQYKWLLLVEKAQALLNTTLLKNPFTAALVGITLLVGAMVTLRNRTKNAASELEVINKKAGEYAAEEKVRLDLIFDKLRKTNPKSKERNQLVKELKEMYPGLLDNMNLEKGGLEDLEKAYGKVSDAIDRNARMRAAEDELTELYKQKRKLESEKNEKKAKYLSAKADADRYRGDVIYGGEAGIAGAASAFQSEAVAKAALDKTVDNIRVADATVSEIKKYVSDIPVTSTGNGVAASFSDSGSGGNTPGKTINDLTSGGSKATNIHIDFRNLIENFSMHPQTLKEGVDDMTDMLIEGMLRVINSSNTIAER